MKQILKTTLFFAAIIAVAFAIQSCNSVKPIGKTQLEGNWVLKTLQGEDAKAAFAGELPSIGFDFEKNSVYGSGGCNRYTGAFTLTGKNEFSAPNLVSTMKICMVANKEPQFLTALSAPNLAVSIENGLLTFSQDKTVLIQFEKETEKPALTTEALTGKWNLASIAGGDLDTLFATRIPTMEITADGNVAGNAGCNNYRSTYTLDSNTVTFGPVISTKMACPGLQGEQLFASFLTTPLQAALDGDKLTFSKEGDVVLELTKAE
ncbi:MAG: META domain-containing protein [Prevotella sp.]|jgi:heat shock protein HslJ|nr:META domain-containing protein [Prevotella sp.]